MKSIVGITIVLFITFAPFEVYGAPAGVFHQSGGLVSAPRQPWTGGSRLAESAQTGSGSNLTWVYVFFHTNLLPGLGIYTHVTAGQLIGYGDVAMSAHDFDNALQAFTNFPTSMPGGSYSQTGPGPSNFTAELDSIFNHMSPAVLQEFASYGITPSNIIVPKAVRDASPCDFTQPTTQDNWVVLNKSVSVTTSIAQPTSNDDFIVSAPVDLSQIQEISKFRSCAGHDYSGLDMQGVNETDRSMKHYFAPLPAFANTTDQVKLFAPFNGTIIQVNPEQNPRGVQVWLTPDVAYTSASSSSYSSSTSSVSATATSSTSSLTTTSTTASSGSVSSLTSSASYSSETTSSQSTVTSSSAASQAPPQNSGAIPEFPSQTVLASALALIVMAAYLAARGAKTKGERPPHIP